jgi:SAM-dependent methyltransferase
MARLVGSVVAVDPCQSMIDAGFARAKAAGLANIEWLCLRAEDMGEELGRFHVATIGQAFHWMERDRVLQKLERVLEPKRGALILINPGKRRPQESWEPIASRVIEQYLGVRDRHGSMHPEAEHEPALRRCAVFGRFTAREFATRIERDVRSIFGYVYSLSSSPRSAFGDRAPQFEQELARALLAASPSGTFTERVETEVFIAPVTNRTT